MLTLDVPVRTDRLVVRAFEPGDLDAVSALHSDAEIIRYIPWVLRTRDESEAWLSERIAQDRLATEGDAVAWAVTLAEDGRFLGSVNARWISVEHSHAEVGFVFARNAGGAGYATEAVRAVVSLLFAGLGVHRVTGRADARNTASARLMARLGMRQEAHFREDDFFKGEWTDTVVFAVLHDEWSEA